MGDKNGAPLEDPNASRCLTAAVHDPYPARELVMPRDGVPQFS
jgi:hypothetical protein